ncbi:MULTISPECIES: glutamine-hydrolyzing carbamoyl-phosphate synthase small subunit [Paenibacillus]|jgi:carbamoyl-phosphate synthase small subunit|uniref:Carbamoyl phosphate synthase small chain n=2 Tax=Paenibacillus barengoltzii TaxID=343517 RepID=R9LGL0_9BACL|nr:MULTISPECIES: glutamine-hydrolyzing carbamoyl-phosphate synthase small subunit [Paenibacillus]EOS57919.1 carbamoyl-phosphate synthase, small subunit [Paenibacillus barengoltzii G22]MDU0329282.1 glutamine-hydrolyzing carbamoyl-phosphate synthase small subunit [Paenibacillus sp. 3LSP]MEC2344154.1 glutamine-hydrolyzing carbamoyl-phosphate synthase small subunit [Paenibacillus barengoltzii]SMF45341.1 carbamoyl-phosphate synthase small subunit [Paenibacillus barengoltzii]SMF59244.1 carbamoyl-pho
MQARLLLEDGTLFTGTSFGAEGEKTGEVVFNTGITGYQEVLSDPSYCGQIVTMTYPLIGNYGISRDDFESITPSIHGFVVRRYEPTPSNWRAQYNLGDLLKEYGIPGIADIDTRMLTRLIRHQGTMRGILTTSNKSVEELKEMMLATSIAELRNQVAQTSTKHVYSSPGSKERIVLVDFGAKSGILRELNKRDCDVVIVPHDTTADEIRRLHPDGIQLSNGPGDPKDVPHAVKMISELLGEYPIFGICLGHQLFALACGADTEKLKFGHRGGNHPVKELATGRCYITSQNHGYTVNEASIAGTELEVTHINNNDKTIEGLKHKKYPAFSVQYHPEAAPGPYDNSYLFDRFIEMIREHKRQNPQKPRQAELMAAAKGEL